MVADRDVVTCREVGADREDTADEHPAASRDGVMLLPAFGDRCPNVLADRMRVVFTGVGNLFE